MANNPPTIPDGHAGHGLLVANESVFNTVGRDQNNNYFLNTPARQDHAPSQPVNDAPVDLLSTHFIGRASELAFLVDVLSRSYGDVPSRCAVYGMPGLGKTQLVLRYAKISFDGDRYTYIFWLSATTIEKLNQGLAGVLDLVGHPDRTLQDQNAKITAARLWLEGSHGGEEVGWLLIVDNVDPKTLEFLRLHLPRKNGRGNILFTTRTAAVAEALVNVAGEKHPTLGLGPLELRDTANLLFEDAGIDKKDVSSSALNEAEDLVKCVGCLPLAVAQVASFMKQTQTTLDEMRELCKGERKIEIIEWENSLTSYEERSVAAIFAHQFKQLLRESPDISNFLKVLSFLDPEYIPIKMLVQGAKEWSKARDAPPPVRRRRKSAIVQKVVEWGRHKNHRAEESKHNSHTTPELLSLIALILSPIQLQAATQTLQKLSLVEHRSHSSALRIHDLVRYMVQGFSRREERCGEWLQLAVSLVSGAFRHIEDHQSPQWWEECERFMPHLRMLNQAWDQVQSAKLELAEANLGIALYLKGRGRYDEAHALCEWIYREYESDLGREHQNTLKAMGILASIYHMQGRNGKAEELNKQVLAGRKKLLGYDHAETLTTMNNLALVYKSQRQYGEAEKLYKQALSLTEKQLGADHPETLTTMNNLANVYELQGRHGEAEAMHKTALAGREKMLGADHPHTLLSMASLALVYGSRKRYGEAEELYKRALVGMDKRLGADHPDTLSTAGNLAALYWSQDRHKDAEALFAARGVGDVGGEEAGTTGDVSGP